MPTTTQRRTNTARRGTPVSRAQSYYGGYQRPHSSTAEAYPYRETYPRRRAVPLHPVTSPKPTASPGKRQGEPVKKAGVSVRKGKQAVRSADRVNLFRIFAKVGAVFLLCFLMIYRYAMILETNEEIDKLAKEFAAIETTNQALQAKIDRELELGALEEYAATQLGMIKPDSSQIFYVDMQLGDGAQENGNAGEESEKPILQGTPGALVHAIQVLK